MGKYFGTDGFRGEAGVTLTADHAYKVGRFLGWYYGMLRQRNGEATTFCCFSKDNTCVLQEGVSQMNSYTAKTSIHCLTVGKLDDIVYIVPANRSRSQGTKED